MILGWFDTRDVFSLSYTAFVFFESCTYDDVRMSHGTITRPAAVQYSVVLVDYVLYAQLRGA